MGLAMGLQVKVCNMQNTRGGIYWKETQSIAQCLVVHFTFMFQMIKSKLEPPSIKGVFFGYNKASKDYRIYNPTQRNTTCDSKYS